MSRFHMLYNDTAVSKVLNIKWPGNWEEEAVFRCDNGQGTIIEGKVKEKLRIAISDATSSRVSFHYNVLNIEFKRAYKRSFDSSGMEIEPWKTATKKVNTGYLSYKTVQVDTTAITLQDASRVLNISELNEFFPKLGSNIVRVFCNEKALPNLEINVGEDVRIKTRGDGPYVEYVARISEAQVSSSEYEEGSQTSWTDKIMSMKAQKDSNFDQPDGVDDSEWD